MQASQLRLKAAILSAAKAAGFQASLFEETQLLESNVNQQRKSVVPFSSFKDNDALEHPYSVTLASGDVLSRSATLTTQVPKASFTNPEAVTEQLCKGLSHDLKRNELKTFKLLHTVALELAAKRNYSAQVTHVSFFCPLEIIAIALEISRTTLWRHLKIMLELGIVSYKPHKTTHRSKTLNDGCLWNIKLNPAKGKSARLSYEELKTQYRDLSLDISNKRTAFAFKKAREEQQENKMKQSFRTTEDLKGKKLILSWTLNPLLSKYPVSSDCFIPQESSDKQLAFHLESMLDVVFVPKDARNLAVQHAASAICVALCDHKSHKFYCDLLWNLLRRSDRGENYFLTVFEMILRARTDHLEGFARSAGALLVSRLKNSQVWEHLKQTPPLRVGTPPALHT